MFYSTRESEGGEIMKNKKLLFIGVLTAFLMLAVPFAVISFDAEDVDATGDYVAEVGDTDYPTLKGAIDGQSLAIPSRF